MQMNTLNQSIKFEECESSTHAFDTPKIVKQFKRISTVTKCIVRELLYIGFFIHLGPL